MVFLGSTERSFSLPLRNSEHGYDIGSAVDFQCQAKIWSSKDGPEIKRNIELNLSFWEMSNE